MKTLSAQYAGNTQNGYRVRVELLPYAPPTSSRGAKRLASTLKKEIQNCKTSWFILELILYENFTLDDWFVTLTYKPDCLPATWKSAMKQPPKFLSKVRSRRKALNLPYDYVYVNECLHGDGRPNHHCVIAAGPETVEQIKSYWDQGFVDVMTIREFGGFQKLAKYITKEPREKGRPRPGQRMWIPSKGLSRPVTIKTLVDDGFQFNEPRGAMPIDDGLAIHSQSPAWPSGEFPQWDMITSEIQTIHDLF